ARVQWRMERGADKPVEPAVPDAVELDRAVVGDHLPLLQEPLAPLELHAEGVVIDVVVGRQGRRVEDGGAAGALKGAHSFSSEAWTKTAPLPLSSSWNASPEPRPTMSRQPSAVDSRLRTSPWWATYACGSTCTARCGVIGSSITPPCAMTATAPCPRRVVVNSPCPETWPRTIPITPPCEPRKTVPCSRVPSKASRRSASTYRVSPERSITWMWWPPCPTRTVPPPDHRPQPALPAGQVRGEADVPLVGEHRAALAEQAPARCHDRPDHLRVDLLEPHVTCPPRSCSAHWAARRPARRPRSGSGTPRRRPRRASCGTSHRTAATGAGSPGGPHRRPGRR